ncbi:hypothetical protein BGZ49_006288 [Haplosporangium sp. Z 27]|nr:hypothetical protein BGZ49_006288 [Haplosporangium sp. Z 27]
MSRDYDAGPRVKSTNFFDVGVVGRRTGITMKANIKKDADGLDNIDDFWDDDDEADKDDNQYQDHNDDRRRSRRMTSPPQRQYLEQELPEELLSTPTSRRLRNVPMSGSTSSLDRSTRGLSLPGSNLYDNADEYQSPSFHAVKKRLVFTNDSSDVEQDQDDFQPVLRKPRVAQSSSPSLDKLLTASREKNAQIKAQTSVSSRPQMTSAAASRRGGMPKAFDLGGDFDDHSDQDDFDYGNTAQSDFDEPVPSTPKRSSKKVTSAQTPAEFRRKSKAVPIPKTTSAQSDDDHYYHEPEPEPEDDSRLRFSDEEDTRNRYSEDDEEDIPPPISKKTVEPVQKKRTASTKEPKSNNRSKMTAVATKDIPKNTKSTSTSAIGLKGQKAGSRAAHVDDSDSDDGRVPLSTQKKSTSGKSKNTMSSSGPKKAAKAITTKSSGSGSSQQKSNELKKSSKTPVELVEIPVVPDVGAGDNGVRRSRRTKIAPLEFWKNERVVFDKDEDSAPVIKAVLRAPPTDEPPRSSIKRKRTTGNGSNSKRSTVVPIPQRKQKQVSVEEEEDELDSSLEESLEHSRGHLGLSDEVASKKAEVLTFGTNKVTLQAIAEAKDSTKFRDVEGGQYQFHRGLEDPDSLASGIIKIKPGGRKATTNSNGSSMVFFVIRGLVQVTVHETDFVVSTGGRFLVPRGNQYGIINLSKKESTLFFTQNKSKGTSASGKGKEQDKPSSQLDAEESESTSTKVTKDSEKHETTRTRRSLPKAS